MNRRHPGHKSTLVFFLCAVIGVGALWACQGSLGALPALQLGIVSLPSATATPSLPPTATPAPTRAPSPTPSATPTHSPTPTAEPTATLTLTPTDTPIPLPTPDGTPRSLCVPILMYHYISTPPADADAIRLDLSVPPERFEQHLQYLRAQGYTSIALRDLILALQSGHPLPEKAIVLTFDDGYRDNYLHAFPLLLKYGFKGTFFIITAYIDEQRPQYVSWEQVVAMHRAGMEIGSHAYTHVDLRNRSADYLVWQMLGSKEAIEARIGEPVRFFCYPAGKYDDLAIEVAHSANYWGAVTVEGGIEHTSDALFELKRVRIHGDDEVSRLDAVLRAWEATACTMTP